MNQTPSQHDRRCWCGHPSSWSSALQRTAAGNSCCASSDVFPHFERRHLRDAVASQNDAQRAAAGPRGFAFTIAPAPGSRAERLCRGTCPGVPQPVARQVELCESDGRPRGGREGPGARRRDAVLAEVELDEGAAAAGRREPPGHLPRAQRLGPVACGERKRQSPALSSQDSPMQMRAFPLLKDSAPERSR